MYVITLVGLTMSLRMSTNKRLARRRAGVLMRRKLRVQGLVGNEEWVDDILNIEREEDIDGTVGFKVSEVLHAENKILTTMTGNFNKGAERELFLRWH